MRARGYQQVVPALSWPRLQTAAGALAAAAALCAGASWLLPMPPDTLPYEPPPPPMHAPLAEPDVRALEDAHQIRGMKALDGLLEARLLAEAPDADLPDPALREAGTSDGPAGPDAEALLVAWGDAFRAQGLQLDGSPRP